MAYKKNKYYTFKELKKTNEYNALSTDKKVRYIKNRIVKYLENKHPDVDVGQTEYDSYEQKYGFLLIHNIRKDILPILKYIKKLGNEYPVKAYTFAHNAITVEIG